MSEKYIRKLITFRDWKKIVLPKTFWDKIKNCKKKIDIILSAEELEVLNNLSIKNANSYLKFRYPDKDERITF